MAGMLTSADKAWMTATSLDALADWGVTGSFRRMTRNGTTGQVAAAAAHLTGVVLYLEPEATLTDDALNAPVGKLVRATSIHYTVPTQVQEGDLFVVTGGATYMIVGLRDYASHLEYLLQTYIPDQTG